METIQKQKPGRKRLFKKSTMIQVRVDDEKVQFAKEHGGLTNFVRQAIDEKVERVKL